MDRSFNAARQFYLEDGQNPDPAGGIFYGFRYTAEHLQEQRDAVIHAIHNLGFVFDDIGNQQIGVRPQEQHTVFDLSIHRRAMALLEELSSINAALDFNSAGGSEHKNISGLCVNLIAHVADCLKEKRNADAYEYVSDFIPRMVDDLLLAHAQSAILSRQEVESLRQISKYAKGVLDDLNRDAKSNLRVSLRGNN